MTTSVYINCCEIGAATGDGAVGAEELKALQAVSDVKLVLDAAKLRKYNPESNVWLQDYFANALIKDSNMSFDLCHIYGDPYGVTVETLKKQGTKIIITIPAHDRKLTIEEHIKWLGKYPFPHIEDDWLFHIYTEGTRNADVVIAPSTNSKNVIVNDIGVSEKKVRIIPHGVTLPNESEIKPLPNNFKVAYLSQVGYDKGIIYLIKAFDELAYPDSELILAGAGTDTLEPLIKQLSTNGRYRLLGRVENVADVYNSCSVFCLPSITEGWGIPLVEAMSYGRPVITTDGCGASDAVEDGEDGYIVNPRDPHAIASKIAWLRDNPQELKRLGENAREKAKEYSWDKIRQQYKSLYLSVMLRELEKGKKKS